MPRLRIAVCVTEMGAYSRPKSERGSRSPGLKPAGLSATYRLRPKAEASGYLPAATPEDAAGDSDSASQNDAALFSTLCPLLLRKARLGLFQRHLKPLLLRSYDFTARYTFASATRTRRFALQSRKV